MVHDRSVQLKPKVRTPSIVLLGNLAMTEFGFGILAQPIFVAHKFGAIYGNVKLHCVA